MGEQTFFLLVLCAVVAPILIFSFVALTASLSNGGSISQDDSDDFLLAARDVSPGDYVNSSTGYMIQVSTTFYFIYWGYNYGLSNVFYMLSWALGIYIFSKFARRLYESRIAMTTLPALLSGNKRNALRVAAALTSILSFVGVFYVEAYFTADLINGVSSINENSALSSQAWWGVFSVIVIIVSLYSLLGGLRKVVATDVWQLSLAYLGIGIAFAYLINKSYLSSPITALILGSICLLLYGGLIFMDRGLRDGKIKIISLISAFFIIGLATIGNAQTGFSDIANGVQISGVFTQIFEPWGWFTLFGFVIVNVFWQFADSSNFQRIAALRLEGDEEAATRVLEKSILSLVIVSPLTWGLGILLGMLVKSAAISVAEPGLEYQGLVEMLKMSSLSGDLFSIVVVIALVVSLVSIMMSTADSALMAASQSFFNDIGSTTNFKQWKAGVFSICVVIMVFILGIAHKYVGSASVLTMMAAAYSAVVILAPITLSTLRNKPVRPIVGTTAIVLGLTVTGVATFGPISDLPFNVQLVLNVVLGFFTSLVIVFIGGLFKSKSGEA